MGHLCSHCILNRLRSELRSIPRLRLLSNKRDLELPQYYLLPTI